MTEAKIITRTLEDNSTWHFVSYSPRGFRNELKTVSFMDKENAEKFVSEIENDADSWVVTGSEAGRRTFDWTGESVLSVWHISEQY